MNHRIPKLALGPILYYWERQTVFDFYRRIADTPVDIVYLGETVCARRRALRGQDWFELAEMLQQAGKQVILSGMTLIEAGSELAALKKLCANRRFMVEANDMAAVQLLSGTAFVCGPAINLYNPRSLQLLAAQGLKRWVLPLELSRRALEAMQRRRPAGVETEVMVYGRMPLAWSARCFTARAHNRPKDDCGHLCLDYPDGMMLRTQDGQNFLVLNGIQTQSARTLNLLAELETLTRLEVDVLRISPPSRHCEKIIELFFQCLHGTCPPAEAERQLQSLMPPGGSCNGYWHGTSGMHSGTRL